MSTSAGITEPRGTTRRTLRLTSWLVFAFFYAPILVLVIFSFSDSRNVGVWGGFTTHWYGDFANDEPLTSALWHSLQVGAVATLVSVVLGTDGPLSQFTEAVGIGPTRVLFTQAAVIIGLVYSYLPFMILPLYAAIERIDGRLLEASRDLYASGFQSFRRVLLPLSMPGVVAGSILVFIPSLGAYVTPEILGGAKTTLLGSYIVTQFLTARNLPFGAAMSTVLMIIMLFATVIYFRKGGRTL